MLAIGGLNLHANIKLPQITFCIQFFERHGCLEVVFKCLHKLSLCFGSEYFVYIIYVYAPHYDAPDQNKGENARKKFWKTLKTKPSKKCLYFQKSEVLKLPRLPMDIHKFESVVFFSDPVI